MKTPVKNNANANEQGSSKSNQAFQSVKEAQKQRGISNSGGQMSYQTDNKQATVNKGNENLNVPGKKQTPQTPSKHSPK